MIDFSFEFKNEKLNNARIKMDENGNLKYGLYYNLNLNDDRFSLLLTNAVALTKSIIEYRNKLEKEQDSLCNNWENDKNHVDYYNKKYLELEDKINNLYNDYYKIVYAILTKEEIDKIQKEIHYNFMSEKFYNKMVELLESKEV